MKYVEDKTLVEWGLNHLRSKLESGQFRKSYFEGSRTVDFTEENYDSVIHRGPIRVKYQYTFTVEVEE